MAWHERREAELAPDDPWKAWPNGAYALRWRRYLTTCVKGETKQVMLGWHNAKCIAEFITICKLLKHDSKESDETSNLTVAVQAKRRKLGKVLEDGEEDSRCAGRRRFDRVFCCRVLVLFAVSSSSTHT
jgi:hypothetical protein